MTTSDPTPVVEVKRFHEAYPGMPLLYHTYCSACPNYGICGKREAAESDAWRHAQSHGRTATPSDPTPGDHDEYKPSVEEFEVWEQELFRHQPVMSLKHGGIVGCQCMDRVFHAKTEDWGTHLAEVMASLIPAVLRTEQSARQAAERDRNTFRKLQGQANYLLARVVSAANISAIEGDDGFIERYDMPVGPIHKAIPFLAQRGIVVTIDGRILNGPESAAPTESEGPERDDSVGQTLPPEWGSDD